MAGKGGVELTGVKETLQNAHNLGFNVKSCVRTAVWRLAGQITTQAKRNVQTLVIPLSAGGTTTGRLAGSITMAGNFTPTVKGLQQPAKSADGLSVPGGGGGADAPFAIVGTNLEYARRIEHGFQGKDSLGRSYNQAPKPYLHPAFFALEGDLPKTLKRVVEEKAALRYFKNTLPYFDSGGIQD